MRWYLGALAALAMAGCGGGSNMNMDAGMDLSIADLSTADLAGQGIIGAPCKSDTDCHDGKTPVCFKVHFNNKVGNVATAGGYCSSTCTADTDCGANGSCIDFNPDGQFCLAKCMAATDCRNRYACFQSLGPACFPNDNLDCDPTANNGDCVYRNQRPGGCIRQALGPAGSDTGQCQEGCEVGKSTCAADVFGNVRTCEVFDERTADDGTATGDLWVGALCDFAATNPPPIADGQECLYTPMGATMASHFFDACVDGDECYLMGMATKGHGFDSGGDNKCHQLCYLSAPTTPDAGTDFSDGGMIAGACATGTCTDVWGLAGSANPAGLCL